MAQEKAKSSKSPMKQRNHNNVQLNEMEGVWMTNSNKSAKPNMIPHKNGGSKIAVGQRVENKEQKLANVNMMMVRTKFC
jgi:hypothetical protein